MSWFAVPHITAENVAILRYVPNIFGCAGAAASVFERVGYLDDAFISPRILVKHTAGVIEDDQAQGISLTGSTRAGRAVTETGGREPKPTVLELGGSDPFVVLDGAPLEATAERAARTQTQGNGQPCVVAKRFFVCEVVYDESVKCFTEEARVLTVGDPTDPETDVRP